MDLLLKRTFLGSDYTIGKLYIDGEYFCDTLEDTVRDLDKSGRFDNGEQKIYGETAIPYGTYAVDWSYSPKFKRYMPEVLNVPHFEGIRIHSGNTAKDTLGCILVGVNREKGKVLDSKITVNKLYPLIEKAKKDKELVILIIE